MATPPPNPFYRRDYACSVKGGQAWLSLPFPGGKIDLQEAQDIIDWLALIVRQLERHAQASETMSLREDKSDEQEHLEASSSDCLG